MKRNRARFIEMLESRRLMATITVTNLSDSGAGTLRQAILDANSGDTINFNVATGTIALASTLTIDKNLTITGPVNELVVINGGGTVQPFVISSSTLNLSNVRITDGFSGGGGGIVVDPTSSIDLTNVAITNCEAESGGGAIFSEGFAASISLTNCSLTGNTSDNGGGGAIESLGTLTIDDSTIANNTADGPTWTMMGHTFAGQSAGGGLELSQGAVTITNSTIANNTATAESASGDTSRASGGGIVIGTNQAVTLLNCTISGNVCQADQEMGGGVDVDSNGTATFTNCLVAGNSASTQADFAAENGSVVSDGHNIVGQISDLSNISEANGASGDQLGTPAHPLDPDLGPLANNGGPTETMALLSGSPAIDSGSNSAAPSTDQRGNSRVGTADVGAFEFQNHAPVFSTTKLGLATAGLPFSTTVTATDADHDSLSFTVVSKPSWLTVHDNGDGTATVSGTPTYLDGGENSLEMKVSDGTSDVDRTFDFGVAVPAVVLDGNGLLSAYGTSGNDTVQIWVRGDGTVRVSSNGVLRNYPLASVHSVQVYSMAGDDSVTLNLKTIPAYVFGGDGNDTITGGDESDTLSGAAGNDVIDGGGGDDRVNGDGGKDIIDGGEGHDRLFGGDGHDVLDARDNMADTLDGGTGVNDAIYDVGLDVVSNV